MRIAICDANSADCEKLSDTLKNWSASKTESMEIAFFKSGETFIIEHNQNPFDAVFLEISLRFLSGMDTAYQLRYLDKSVRIIFLTASPEYAVESYTVRAFDYILKPFAYDRLTVTMDLLAKEISATPDFITLQYDGLQRKCYFHQISYIEVQSHKVHVHMTDGSIAVVNQPLHTFEEKLQTNCMFCKCHRSYIVSLSQVAAFSYGEITMQNGDCIPLSRTFVKEFKDKYHNYISA